MCATIGSIDLYKEGNFYMMYMHYCQGCKRIHILNGHKNICPACGQSLNELRISYMDYVAMDSAKRNAILLECQDASRLRALSTTYRMSKYSKHYQNYFPTNKTQKSRSV